MKILDVKPFQEGIERNSEMLNRLCEEMETVSNTVQGLIAMDDSLKGEGGDAIRSFYEECHLPFTLFFDSTSREFIDKLRWMKNALDALESNPNGYIKQEFLEGAVEEGLQEIAQVTESLTDEANGIMDKVSDIVALPHLDDTDVQEGVTRAGTRRDETITQLGAFDSDQTRALTSVETNFRAIETWIADLEGLFEDGLTGVDFPADLWAEYVATNPIKTDMAQSTEPVDGVNATGDEGKTGDVTSTEKTTTDHIKKGVVWAGRIDTGFQGAWTTGAMGMAAWKGGLHSSPGYPDLRNGGKSYRVYANEKGMKYLGVDIKNANDKQFLLKAASKKPDSKSTWFSKEAQAALKKHPPLEYWSNHSTKQEKAKMVGKATVKGIGSSFKDTVDFKGIKNAGPLKVAGKALAPVGALLNIHTNYQDAKKDNLSGAAAVTSVVASTALDTAVAGAVQAASVAAFTVAVPIPGLGTALGVAVGIGINALLTRDDKTGKSPMGKLKGKLRGLFK